MERIFPVLSARVVALLNGHGCKWWFPCEDCKDIVNGQFAHIAARILRCAAKVRRQHNPLLQLGQRGIGFIFISHKKEYEIKIGPRSETAVNTTIPSGAQKFIHGFVDYIWYFTQTQDGKRFVLTDRHDNINAGSRGDLELEPLPLKMPMDADVIKKLLARQKPRKTPVSLFEFEDDEF